MSSAKTRNFSVIIDQPRKKEVVKKVIKMKLSFVAFLMVLFVGLASSAAITGRFVRNGTDYICRMTGQSYRLDDPLLKIYGKHIKGKLDGKEFSYGNHDVTILDASNQNNSLEMIPTTCLQLFPNVKEMRFEATNLQLLDEKSFSSCASLETIIFGSDTISSISADVFKTCSKLQTIEFNENEILVIDNQAFAGVPTLKRLVLKGNKLSSLSPDLFEPLTGLLELVITGNPLKTIEPGQFLSQKLLVSLDLSYNELNYVSSFWFVNKSDLKSVDLSNNDIEAIDEHLLEEWFHSAKLNLLGNECINKKYGSIGSEDLPVIEVVPDFKICFDNDADILKVQGLNKLNHTEHAKGNINSSSNLLKTNSTTKKVENTSEYEYYSDSEEEAAKTTLTTATAKNTTEAVFESDDSSKDHDRNTSSISDDKSSLPNNKSDKSQSESISDEDVAVPKEETEIENVENETDKEKPGRRRMSTKVPPSTHEISDKNSTKENPRKQGNQTKTSDESDEISFSFEEGDREDDNEEKNGNSTETSRRKNPLDTHFWGQGSGEDLGADEPAIEEESKDIEAEAKENLANGSSQISSETKSPTGETTSKPHYVHAYEQATCRFYIDDQDEYICVLRNAKRNLKHINIKHEEGYDNENVTYVSFTDSELAYFPRVIFDEFPNLKKVSAARTGIKTMDSDMFEVCGNLQALDISHNQISHVKGDSLKMCPMLELVDISGNPITTIDSDIFECNPNLHVTYGSLKIVSTK